jgi:hypothetical protein
LLGLLLVRLVLLLLMIEKIAVDLVARFGKLLLDASGEGTNATDKTVGQS